MARPSTAWSSPNAALLADKVVAPEHALRGGGVDQSSGWRQRSCGNLAKSRSKLIHSQPCSSASAAC